MGYVTGKFNITPQKIKVNRFLNYLDNKNQQLLSKSLVVGL